mgnify:CR=1 FL=1
MFTVAAFYRFTRLPDPAALRGPLRAVAEGQRVRGSILLAPEGLNGTIAATAAGIAATLAHLRTLPGCADLEPKLSTAPTMPFGRLKLRLKREIVTLGRPEADPTRAVGTYVPPSDWNALVADPGTVLIDTRNAYEVAIGTFPGALDPGTEAFGDFPAWWEATRDSLKGKRIAMFCTGGIRCEKATALLRAEGVEDVFHLQGGILKYLEDVPASESLWQGECFVFDGRVSVGPGLQPGDATSCAACRRALMEADRAHALYEEGAACAACAHEYTEADRARFRERHRQIGLAAARGQRHIGG